MAKTDDLLAAIESIHVAGLDAEHWPKALAATARLLGGNAVPRRRGDWLGLTAGGFATLAVAGFLLARQQGLLSVSAVLTSLYPAATVLLATLLLHERLHRGQSVGLLLCAVSVVCVALG